MLHYIVEGGNKLEGEVNVSGSKNASLPIIAATILSGKTTILYNVPRIYDTKTMFEILRYLGCIVKEEENKIIINSSKIDKFDIPEELMRKMRSSVILVGAIIGRLKKATFSYPGGCDIGARPIDLHLTGFEKLGITIEEKGGYINCNCEVILANKINLDFPSVGATENIMLASVLANGKTTITNAAMEPEIVDLQNILNKMGAKIEGAGTNTIEIEGVKNLNNVIYQVMPDRIEAGTLLCATSITGGNILLKKCVPEHITPILYKLNECGVKTEIKNDTILLNAPKKLNSVNIKTMPYPAFPTDMQSVFVSILTVAKGTSIVVENIFENRFKYINELKRMGCKITVEGNTAIIKGVKKLYGANVEATDLRGGAALIIAGLVAKGETVINNAEYILRGYEKIEEKLTNLGAKIRICHLEI